MPDIRFQPASVEVTSEWQARRGSLERSLSTSPDSRCSWLWRIRLRICTYLLRRYGAVREMRDDAPSQGDQPWTELTVAPKILCRNNPSRPVVPLWEIQRRTQIRDRQHPTLERLAGVGHDTRERTAIVVNREQERQSRYEAIWDSIAHVSLRLVQALGALLAVGVLVSVALIYPMPYIAIVFVTSSALAIAWWRSLR